MTSVRIFQFPYGTGSIIGQPAICGKENLNACEYVNGICRDVPENSGTSERPDFFCMRGLVRTGAEHEIGDDHALCESKGDTVGPERDEPVPRLLPRMYLL